MFERLGCKKEDVCRLYILRYTKSSGVVCQLMLMFFINLFLKCMNNDITLIVSCDNATIFGRVTQTVFRITITFSFQTLIQKKLYGRKLCSAKKIIKLIFHSIPKLKFTACMYLHSTQTSVEHKIKRNLLEN